MSTAIISGFIRAVELLSRLCGVIAAIMLIVAVAVVCQMVTVRYVLQESSIWQTEFVTYLLIAVTFIGSPYVLMTRGHVRVELLPAYLGPTARFYLALVTCLAAFAFCLLIAWLGYEEWSMAWESNWRSDTVWEVRLWIPYLAMPIGFGLLSLQYLADIFSLLTGRSAPFESDLE